MWYLYVKIGFKVSKYISNDNNRHKIEISEEEKNPFPSSLIFGTGFFFSNRTSNVGKLY